MLCRNENFSIRWQADRMLIFRKITRKGRRKMGVRGNNSPECATALPPRACGLLRLFSGLSLRNMSEPPPLPPESAVKSFASESRPKRSLRYAECSQGLSKSLTRKSNWAKPDLARGSTCRGDVWRLTAVVAGSQRRWRCTGQRHRCGAMKPQPGPASARASALAVGRRTQKGLRLNAQ